MPSTRTATGVDPSPSSPNVTFCKRNTVHTGQRKISSFWLPVSIKLGGRVERRDSSLLVATCIRPYWCETWFDQVGSGDGYIRYKYVPPRQCVNVVSAEGLPTYMYFTYLTHSRGGVACTHDSYTLG